MGKLAQIQIKDSKYENLLAPVNQEGINFISCINFIISSSQSQQGWAEIKSWGMFIQKLHLKSYEGWNNILDSTIPSDISALSAFKSLFLQHSFDYYSTKRQ